MPQVLFVHSSPPASEVRRVSQGFCTRQMARVLKEQIKGRDVRIVDRDVAANPPGMVDSNWIAAANKDQAYRYPADVARLKESDMLSDEVLKSDVIVIACPLISGHIPMPLKAWMDNIVRPGKTFTKPDNKRLTHTYGLLHDKLVVLLETETNDARPRFMFQAATDAQLRATLTKLGVKSFERVTVKEGDNPAIEPCDPVSWVKCEAALQELASKLKQRWEYRAQG